MRRVQLSGRVEAVVDATPDQVWQVVSDVTRTGEWSHECVSVAWVDEPRARPGARFRGGNRAGPWRWSRTCELVTVDEPRELSWRTVPTLLFPDSTLWSLRLEPAGDGTRIVQSFEVVRAPWLLDRVYGALIPSHQDRDARLAEDLARIGPVAAAGTPGAAP